jgi:hypothetical protein
LGQWASFGYRCFKIFCFVKNKTEARGMKKSRGKRQGDDARMPLGLWFKQKMAKSDFSHDR